VTAAEIRAALAIEPSAVHYERSYRYRHLETGRQFAVRRSKYVCGKCRFFLCELRPNGRMAEVNEQGDVVRAWDEPRITETESRVSPNELIATLRASGIDVEEECHCSEICELATTSQSENATTYASRVCSQIVNWARNVPRSCTE
jgi:hypothetical protein